MPKPFVLWLIWQNEKTRQKYHVANLEHIDGEYVFYYINNNERRKLKEAMNNGYKPHLAFTNFNKTYKSSQLFGPFARRLPDKRRPDYHKILSDLGLTTDCTEMDLLRATGGRLATDSYEFVSPIYIEKNHFDFDFYVAGWQYYDGDKVISELKPGMEVNFKLEPSNPQDPKAVITLLNNKGCKLGYIPSYYSDFMFFVIDGNGEYKARIGHINPNAKAQQKVNILVVGTFKHERVPFLEYNKIQSVEYLSIV